MSDIRARRLPAVTLSRCRRAWLCGFLILATPPISLPATPGQQQKEIVIDDFESGTLAGWKIEPSGAGNSSFIRTARLRRSRPRATPTSRLRSRTRLKASLPR